MNRIVSFLLITVAIFALSAQAPKVLTNQDVLDMVGAKLSDSVIVSAIRTSTCKFSTGPQDLIALTKAGVSDAVMQVMTEAGAAHDQGARAAPSQVSPTRTFAGPPGMAVAQDDVSYDGSTFKVTSMNGVVRSVVEMKPGGQPIASVIMPDGRIMTPALRGDASYANRIKAVLKIHAGGQAASATGATQGDANVASGQPGTATASVSSGNGAPAGLPDSQQDLQGYEGSLGSLGDAQIVLPGSSIQSPEGALKNENDSNRVIVYFARTREKVSFSSSKSSNHKDDVVALAGRFGSGRMPSYVSANLWGRSGNNPIYGVLDSLHRREQQSETHVRGRTQSPDP